MEQRLYDAAAKLPATNAKLDTSQMTGKIRATNSIGRVVITLAACAAAMCMILFGALSLASSVKEYNDAVAYFSMHNLSTDGLTRGEIKAVYKDIATGTFTHPKTAGLLAGLDITKLGSADSTLSANRKLQEMYGQYFDMERAHKPLSLDIQRVKLGMHITEVIELLGKPHNFGQTTDAISLEWQTTNGWRYVICVTEEAGTEGMNIFQRYTQHSTVSANPTVLDPIPVLSDRYRELYGNYFDLEREHKPSEADILTVTQKMPIKEVFDLLGKPHGMYQITNTILLWESAQGQTYSIQFYRTDDSPKDIPAIERDLKYGVVVVQPAAWPPEWMVFYYDPTEPTEPTEPLEPTDPTDPTDTTDGPPVTDPTNPTDPEAEMLAQYFDLEKTHRPTFDEVLSIQEGTPVQDVVALIGKPHGFAPGHSWPAFWWETVEGYTFIIDLAATSGFLSAQNTVERYFKYCTVDWVVPLIELEVQGGDTSENYDEAGIYNAANKYFTQREAYLLGEASTMNNVNSGLVPDEDAHKAAIAEAGIQWLGSDIVIHAIAYWDSHAQVVATETVTYLEDGVEKTEAIIHRLQLGQVDDGRIFTVGDHYYESITGFKSCSYIAPPYQTPQPNLIKPEASDALPEYTPGSIKLAAKDAYTTWAPKDRQYRASYYLIMGDFADVVRKSQPDAYNQWKSEIDDAVMRGEWQDEMLLVTYIKHFDISREAMEEALQNYIYKRTPLQLQMEFYEVPNLDIIYTFDNDIINHYYRYELASTDPIPQSNLDPVTGLPIGVPEGFEFAPQDAGEITPRDRKYRVCYYQALGPFTSLGADRPDEKSAILQERWAAVKQGIYRDEMYLVSIIKGLNIPREEFDQAVAKYLLQHDPENLMTEYYEIPNGDIIYTFDNEIINAYYRYEEPDWGVVPPKLTENKENKGHLWYDGKEYHYVDLHLLSKTVYRSGYHNIWGEFLELANNRPGKSFDEWVKLRIAETSTAQACNEAALISFLKYFEVPKEDFEAALEKYISRHTPQELDWDYYWVLPDADTIYTFDNEIINEYYRK